MLGKGEWGFDQLQDRGRILANAPVVTLSRSRQRLLRRISTRRGREAERVVLLEGPRVLTTAVQNGAEILFVVREGGVRDSPSLPHAELFSKFETEVVGVPPGGLKEFAATDNQGVLAVAREPRTELTTPQPIAGSPASPCTLVLDGVQDPGNAGTLVRAAAALGVGRVFGLDGTVDLWSAKAVRASAGLVFHLPIHTLDWGRAQAWLEAAELPLLVAHPQGQDVREWLRADGAEDVRDRHSSGWALLVGNETAGPRREALEAAAAQLSIPVPPGVDSLNVAMAGAILLWTLGPAREIEPGRLR